MEAEQERSDNLDETARSLKLSLFCHYRRAKTSENRRTRMKSEFALNRWLTRGSVDFERLRRRERNGFQVRSHQRNGQKGAKSEVASDPSFFCFDNVCLNDYPCNKWKQH